MCSRDLGTGAVATAVSNSQKSWTGGILESDQPQGEAEASIYALFASCIVFVHTGVA